METESLGSPALLGSFLYTHIYTHTMEYYSAIKSEIITSAATLMHPVIITLGEIRQREKDKYFAISPICGI